MKDVVVMTISPIAVVSILSLICFATWGDYVLVGPGFGAIKIIFFFFKPNNPMFSLAPTFLSPIFHLSNNNLIQSPNTW